MTPSFPYSMPSVLPYATVLSSCPYSFRLPPFLPYVLGPSACSVHSVLKSTSTYAGTYVRTNEHYKFFARALELKTQNLLQLQHLQHQHLQLQHLQLQCLQFKPFKTFGSKAANHQKGQQGLGHQGLQTRYVRQRASVVFRLPSPLKPVY